MYVTDENSNCNEKSQILLKFFQIRASWRRKQGGVGRM